MLSVSSVCQANEFLDMKRINKNCYQIFYNKKKKLYIFIFAGKTKTTLFGKHVNDNGQRQTCQKSSAPWLKKIWPSAVDKQLNCRRSCSFQLVNYKLW